MPRGRRRTQYIRDAQGQFASTPGGGKKATPSAVRKAAKAAVMKGGSLQARSSLKRSRAKLAAIDAADPTLQSSLNKRAQKGAVTRAQKKAREAIKTSKAKLKPATRQTISKTKRAKISKTFVVNKESIPASKRPGSITSTLRNTLKKLAEADAKYVRELESMGIKLPKTKAGKAAAQSTKSRIENTAKSTGSVAKTLKASLRELALSDARRIRETEQAIKDATPKVSGKKSNKTIKKASSGKALKPSQPTAKKQKSVTSKKKESTPARKVNPAAERAKKMAIRSGIAPGSKFEHGKSVKTLSLKEMRSAVIKSVKGLGALGMASIATSAGTGKGDFKIESGRMPRTRGEWEAAYRKMVAVPQNERQQKRKAGIINGIDIHKTFRPWAVFGLNPKTATKQDINNAFKKIARTVHPDVGGRAKDFERIKKMRDTAIALKNMDTQSKPTKKKN